MAEQLLAEFKDLFSKPSLNTELASKHLSQLKVSRIDAVNSKILLHA